MTNHSAEVLASFELVHLDLFRIASDNEVAIVLVLEEMDTENLSAFEKV